jgi:hypothetical protein
VTLTLDPAAVCRNCGEAAPGRYCPECGQETALHPPSALEFLHEFVGHYVALEGALWRSLRALAIPGCLTLEYYAGRRRRYVLPLRLYLTASLVFFLALKLAGPHPPLQVNLFIPAASEAARAAPAVPCKFQWAFCQRINSQVEARYGKLTRAEWWSILGANAQRVFPYVMFVLVPVFALVTRVAYWSGARNYGEHLVFALHTHAAAFFLGTLLAPLGDPALFGGAACGYTSLAIVLVFGDPRRVGPVLRAMAATGVYGAMVLASIFAVIMATAFV